MTAPNAAAIQAAANSLQGTKLWNRSCEVIFAYDVGGQSAGTDVLGDPIFFNPGHKLGLDISGFDFAFEVAKSLRVGEPNNCMIKIWNLAEDTRLKLSGDRPITCKLSVGYGGVNSQIYFAELHSAMTSRAGPNFISVLESSETIAKPAGVRSTKKVAPGDVNGHVYRTTGAYIPLDQAFQVLATAMGVGPGNLTQALNGGGLRISSIHGSALVGNAAKRMTDVCRSAGLEWSIQDGLLQLLPIAEALKTVSAIEISDDTGMIDSPVVDSQGNVAVSTLLIPGLAPGVLISIDSLFIQGGSYRIEKIRYVGDTKGPEWYAHIEASKY